MVDVTAVTARGARRAWGLVANFAALTATMAQRAPHDGVSLGVGPATATVEAANADADADADANTYALVAVATAVVAAVLHVGGWRGLAASAFASASLVLAHRLATASMDRFKRWRGKRRARVSKGKWFLVEYDWEPGAFYPAQIWGYEGPQSGFTVQFEWGCLQMSTSPSSIRWDTGTHDLYALSTSPRATTPDTQPMPQADENDDAADNVYLAARRGDLESVKRFLPRLASVDEPERVGRHRLEGRSALYWACITGHVHVVEYLLAQGARDADGSAFAAATCSAPVRSKEDARDLLFDPDAGVFTENSSSSSATVAAAQQQQHQLTDGRDDNSRRIRALLTQARARETGVTSLRDPLLKAASRLERVYVPDDDAHKAVSCVVCFTTLPSAVHMAVCVPCGHASTCQPCAERIRRQREGCPVCRDRILGIVVHVAFKSDGGTDGDTGKAAAASSSSS